MKYLIVYNVEGNYGGEYEDSRELATYDDLVDAFEMHRHQDPQMYEITRMIRPSEVISTLTARALDEKKLRETALAKLTPSERQILGLTS